MPQMAPYNWIFLCLLFYLTMSLIIAYHQFSYYKEMTPNQPHRSTPKFKWTW